MTEQEIKLQTDLMQVEKVIKRIRESFSNSIEVYTCGSCYKFAMILKEIYPYGKILTNEDHAIFELRYGYCYDITGRVKKDKHTPLAEQGCNKVFDKLNLIYKGKAL